MNQKEIGHYVDYEEDADNHEVTTPNNVIDQGDHCSWDHLYPKTGERVTKVIGEDYLESVKSPQG